MNILRILKKKILPRFLALAVLVSVISVVPMQLAMAASGTVTGTQAQIPAYIGKSATKVEVLKLTITQGDPADFTTLDKVIVTMLGDTGAVAADGVLLLKDDGGTAGEVDGTDTQVANASISGGSATLNLPSNYADDIGDVAAGGTLTYFVAVNVAADAATGNTIDARIDADNITFNLLGSSITLPDSGALGGSQYITVDATAPTVASRTTVDTNDNGYIDRIIITTTDTNGLNDDFSGLTVDVAGVAGEEVVTGNTSYDNIFWVNFTDSTLTSGATPGVNISANTSLGDYYSNDYYNIELANDLGTSNVSATDLARPILLAIANYDTDSNGANDEIYLTFSENITDASVAAGDIRIDANADGVYEITDAALDGTVSHGQTDAANDQYLTLTSASLAGTGTAKVGVQVQASAITDAATSPNTSGAAQAIAYNAGLGNTDKALPIITAAETGDNNANGFIDNYKLTFSEQIEGSTLTAGGANGFAVANFGNLGGESEQLDASASGTNIDTGVNYQTLYLTFSEEDTYADGGTGVTPQITYSDDSISGVTDDTGIKLGDIDNAALTESDDSAPVLVSAASNNILQAGNIINGSTITLNFSESVTAASANFTLTTQRDGSETAQEYTPSSFDGATAAINDGTGTSRTLTVTGATTGSSPSYTMGESQTQGYWTTGAQFKFTNISAGTIKDAADHDVIATAGYVSLSAEDNTAPSTVKVVGYDDGSLTGTANDGKLDKIEMYFNEALVDNTYDTADFTVLTANNGAGDQALTLSSVARSATVSNLVILDLNAAVSGTGAIVVTYKDDTAVGNDITDGTPNKYSNGVAKNPATTDGVAPIVLTQKYKDPGTDGSVDRLELVFTENVTWNGSDLTQVALTANDLTGFAGNPSAVAGSGTYTLTLTTAATTDLTGVGAGTEPTYAYTQSGTAGNRIVDGSTNYLANISATSIADSAAPVVVAAYAGDKGGTPDVMNEAGDKYKIVLSESLGSPSATEADYETNFVFGDGIDGDNFPTKNGGGIRVARETTSKANDTLVYTFVAGDTANADAVTPGTDTIDVNIGNVVANSIEDTAGNDMVDTKTHSPLTLTALDVEPPAFVSAAAIDNTHIAITFGENITIIGTPTWGTAITATGITATAGSVDGAVLTVTVNALNNTAFTATDLAVGVSTVEDAAGNDNEAMAGKAIADGQVPALVSAKFTDLTHLEMTFSENMGLAATVDETKITVTNNTGDSIAVTDNSASVATTKVTVTTANVATTAFSISTVGQGLDLAAGAVQDLATAPNSNVEDLDNAVADGIAPTFVSAVATSNTNIRMTFSEQVTVTTANGSDFTSTGPDFTATAAVINADPTKVDLTVNALNNTAFTSSDLDIAANAVRDVSAATNGIAEDLNNSITDGQVPVISTATLKDRDADGKVDAVDIVFSESITDATFESTNWTIGGQTSTGAITTVGGDADANDEKLEVQYNNDDLAVNTAANAAQVVFTDGDSITDAASNYLAANSSITEVDGAAPVPVSAASNRAIISGDLPSGTVITVTFSEAVTVTPGSIDVADAGDDNAGNDTSVYFNPTGGASDYVIANLTDETARFTDGGGTTMVITSDGATGVAWTTSAEFNLNSATVAAIVDAAANAAVPASADIAISGLLDTTPPTVSASYTLDQDGDGKIDGVSVVFNESMDSARTSVTGVSATGYTVSGTDGTWSTTVITDDTFTFNLTENTYDTDATPAVGYTNPGDVTGLQDLSGNDLASYAPAAIVDAAKPVIVSISTMDDDSDGKIDMIKATISENVSDASFDNTKDSITVLTLSGSLASPTSETDTANDNIIYIGITEGSANTGDIGDYIADAGLINDRASSPNAMAAVIGGTVAETDGAKPVLVSAASDNILQAGNIVTGSTVTLTFSETVAASGATFTAGVSRDGTEGAQSYTNGTEDFDGSTASIADESGDATLVMTLTGATDGTDPDFSMGGSQNQGYWTDTAKLYFSAATGITDAATVPNSLNVVPTTGVSINAEDGTAPNAVSVVGYDDGSLGGVASDGKLDKIEIYFNEALAAGTYDNADFTTLTVDNGTGAQALTLTSAARDGTTNNLVVLNLNAAVSGTGAIVLTYKDDTAGGTDISDTSANKYSNGVAKTPATTDAVSPAIVSTDINDSDADGYLNELVITYSEAIAPSSVWTSGDWTITDGNGSTNLVTDATGADSGRTFTITFADTAGSTAAPTFVYTAGTSITDGTNTALSSGSVTPTDDVAPALMSAAPSSATTITAVFSETLLASSVARTDFDISTMEGMIVSATPSSNSVAIKLPAEINAWTLVGQTFSLLAGQSVTDAIPNTLSGLKTKTIGSASASLVSIDVTPNTPTIRKGDTLQLTATGTYSDNSTANITDSVTWSSSNTGVATISSTGLATGILENQSTVITASLSGVSGTETLTVNTVTLSSIAITPTTASVANGATQQFTAVGTYSDASTGNITSQVVWTSANSAVATISSTGLATVVAASGTSNITATLSGITSNTAVLTASAKTASSLAVTPASATIANGTTQQFTATVTYTDNTTADVSASATWTSSNAAAATVGASTGLATAVAQGSTVITATYGALSDTAALTVSNATLSSIAITPTTASLPDGSGQQFIATGTYSDGTTANITDQVIWTSSDTNVAQMYQSTLGIYTGLAYAVTSTGTSNITAALSGVTSNTAVVTATAAIVTSVQITPDYPHIGTTATQQFAAIATYSDGSTTTVTDSATWTSSDTGVATIGSLTGLAAAVAVGNTTIAAVYDGESDETTLTILEDYLPGDPAVTNYSSGVYNSSITVYLTAANASEIRYTTNGTTPTAASTLYTTAGITVSADTTLKAIAYNSTHDKSSQVVTFVYVLKTDLDGTATQTIVLKNGEWNIFSVPKVVDSFSADTTPAQTTLTGLVSKLGTSGAAYLIEGGTWRSLIAGAVASSTHAHYQLEVPQPLYGYVIYNDSGADITLSITYDASVTQQNSIFDRTLSAGWNSVGIADYQGALEASESTALNVDTSDGMGGMAAGVIGYVLDYTANANNSSVDFAAVSTLRRSGVDLSTINIVNPRETRGYLIFVPQGGSYAGSQYYSAAQ